MSEVMLYAKELEGQSHLKETLISELQKGALCKSNDHRATTQHCQAVINECICDLMKSYMPPELPPRDRGTARVR